MNQNIGYIRDDFRTLPIGQTAQNDECKCTTPWVFLIVEAVDFLFHIPKVVQFVAALKSILKG